MILKKKLFSKTFITLVLLLRLSVPALKYDRPPNHRGGSGARPGRTGPASQRHCRAKDSIGPGNQPTGRPEIELTHQRVEVVEQATGVNRIKGELEQRDSELVRKRLPAHRIGELYRGIPRRGNPALLRGSGSSPQRQGQFSNPLAGTL